MGMLRFLLEGLGGQSRVKQSPKNPKKVLKSGCSHQNWVQEKQNKNQFAAMETLLKPRRLRL
jgi:hypothetical protein